jgi:hypothetical protein
MIVNKKRLEKLIGKATFYCEDCPMYEAGEWGACNKYRQDTLKSCSEAILNWVQEMDIAEALEEGAHIVNDQVVFPPVSLPNNFTLNVPCDSGKSCTSSCPWFNNCPFEDD